VNSISAGTSRGTVEFFQHKLNVLKGHCDAVGRDFDEIVQTWSVSCVAVADTEAEAEQIARKSQFFSEDGAIYGTPEQLVEKFQERAAAGCEHFQLRFADFPSTEGVARFGIEVLPKVR
jgi:alkanesulfonate monooxygenase SsuD/methylene tetrahydromethanopterin reductase-like flavin-dependent oxidoreductase (luciferase family)